eukprot:jgi/Hompol1/4545/HPOL_000101-RA
MEADGLVQLADFGVSSSLMETGDRRGIRKTFVGTPCWMAPEVMEQSGYDYKADIWSFGITALELANGHAPYAKFPPLKVLMLTLHNEPPTLDRDGSKNRFSKSFKEMIDSCLKKDPSKRPSAEKLLQHSFFKSAKKSNHLVTSIISKMVPITQRQHLHRTMPQSQSTIQSHDSHESWDFDISEQPQQPPAALSPEATMIADMDTDAPGAGQDPLPPLAMTGASRVESAVPAHLYAARPKSVSFQDSPIDLSVEPPPSAPALAQPPRRSRFTVDSSASTSVEAIA